MSETTPILGVIFPSRDIGADRNSLIEFAPGVEAIEALSFIIAYDHNTAVRPEQPDISSDVSRNFTADDAWHEPLTLFAAMAAQTERIELITGCLILPQRPTVLVAKQAAEVDIISGGRLILGVAVGWNDLESAALGHDFHARAQRIETQIPLLRRLWAGEDVSASLQNEHFQDVSLMPSPTQQPIPLWMGGLSRPAMERTVALADGWIALDYIDVAMEIRLQYLRELANSAGRTDLSIVGRINPWRDSYEKCLADYRRWTQQGATHIAIGTSKGCFVNCEQYFDDASRFVEYLNTHTS